MFMLILLDLCQLGFSRLLSGQSRESQESAINHHNRSADSVPVTAAVFGYLLVTVKEFLRYFVQFLYIQRTMATSNYYRR